MAVNAIASRLLNRIQNIILGWYNYIYDNALLTFIDDGGSDMYDVGNEVSYFSYTVLWCFSNFATDLVSSLIN